MMMSYNTDVISDVMRWCGHKNDVMDRDQLYNNVIVKNKIEHLRAI